MKRLIIFDLDNTLYKNEHFTQMFRNSVYNSVCKAINVSYEKAKNIFEKKRLEIKKETGLKPGTTKTLYLHFGISIDDFENEKLKEIEKHPLPYLNSEDTNLALKDMLIKLTKNNKLIVFTNNHKRIANMILSRLDLDNFFDKLYSLNDMSTELSAHRKIVGEPISEIDKKIISFIKPSKERLEQIIKDYNIESTNCISIGDRFDIDLVYAEELGMKTILVRSVQELIQKCLEFI